MCQCVLLQAYDVYSTLGALLRGPCSVFQPQPAAPLALRRQMKSHGQTVSAHVTAAATPECVYSAATAADPTLFY